MPHSVLSPAISGLEFLTGVYLTRRDRFSL
jgi:hypothetical protein